MEIIETHSGGGRSIFATIRIESSDYPAIVKCYVGTDGSLRITSFGDDAAMTPDHLLQVAAWIMVHWQWIVERIKEKAA